MTAEEEGEAWWRCAAAQVQFSAGDGSVRGPDLARPSSGSECDDQARPDEERRLSGLKSGMTRVGCV